MPHRDDDASRRHHIAATSYRCDDASRRRHIAATTYRGDDVSRRRRVAATTYRCDRSLRRRIAETSHRCIAATPYRGDDASRPRRDAAPPRRGRAALPSSTSYAGPRQRLALARGPQRARAGRDAAARRAVPSSGDGRVRVRQRSRRGRRRRRRLRPRGGAHGTRPVDMERRAGPRLLLPVRAAVPRPSRHLVRGSYCIRRVDDDAGRPTLRGPRLFKMSRP